MKNLMAVVALILCGTAGADAAEPGVDIADWLEKWCSEDGHTFEEIGIVQHGPSVWGFNEDGTAREIRPFKSLSIVVKIDGKAVKTVTDEQGHLIEPVTEKYVKEGNCIPDEECEADGFTYQGHIFLSETPCD
jgi:hypothetical protein